MLCKLLFGFVDFQYLRLTFASTKFRPGSRIRRKATHEIVYLLHSLAPIDAAGFLENLWSRTKFGVYLDQFFLRNRLDRAGKNRFDRFKHQITAKHHEFVVHDFHIVGIGNRYTYLLDNVARINFMLQEESSDTRFRIPVDNRPVDGSGSSILRQESRMKVERTHRRHGPHHLGQHTKSHHNLQVGLQGTEFFQESLVFQTLGLQHFQTLRNSILFHRAGL